MSLSVGYESLSVREASSSTTIPKHRLAKLMYYLYCVFGVIQYDGAEKYTDYRDYDLLSSEEERTVLELAKLFTPKLMSQLSLFLIGYDYVPDSSYNKFYEVTNDKIGLHINSEVMIGGVSRRVLMVMGCTEEFLKRNYYDPIESYTNCYYCGIFERCFDSCCSYCDCGCGPTCKICWCIFFDYLLKYWTNYGSHYGFKEMNFDKK